MQFVKTKEYIDQLQAAISNDDKTVILGLINDLHPADIAEIFDDLTIEEAKYIFLLLGDDLAADTLTEIEEDNLLRFIEVLPPKAIASKFIKRMDSDDAADVLGQMSNEQREAVLAQIDDRELLADIVDLLNYEEDTAGGLMAKEMVIVREDDTVIECLKELTRQAENIDEIYYIYVVNNFGMLKGVLTLKDLILNRTSKSVKDIYDPNVIYVNTSTHENDVASMMSKYDMVVLPVVDTLGRLVGRITVDDVIDIAREEADRDYQMMSGFAEDVEPSDKLGRQVRARLPWLVIGLIGGILSSVIISTYEGQLAIHPSMAFFLTLIAAMGGNVGVQSSAIIVQGLANNTLGVKSTFSRLFRELLSSLIMGAICALALFVFNYFFGSSQALTYAASVALLVVMVFASIFGTIVPLALNKVKIDPALATGPFITTINDIVGLFCYLSIGKFFFDYFAL
ncbi:Mg2+ transporter MgtE [Balneicella halophila]|uniref:Magnesium transporter MgtE n=1 Tax=Balneicella halophila TaxID=1537566 RepID=A0A7L4UPA7_BALHA|nr:magnesium transporter [Balneicella halophila]PVX50717.1 Mg2+ transporter MgtE [Balneicella halophila]